MDCPIHKYYLYPFIILLIVTNSNLYGLEVNNIEIFEDVLLKEDIYTISNKDDLSWKKEESLEIMRPPSGSRYWVRFRLKNNKSIKSDVSIVLKHLFFDQVQFFVKKDSVLLSQSILMGDITPYNNREYDHPYFIHQFELGETNEVEVYCMIRKEGGRMRFLLELFEETELEYWLMKDTLYKQNLILYFGFITFLSLCFFLFTRQNLAFYFFMMMMSITIYLINLFGWGFQYVWSNAPVFQQYSSTFFSSFIMLSLIFMADSAYSGIKSKVESILLDISRYSLFASLIFQFFISYLILWSLRPYMSDSFQSSLYIYSAYFIIGTLMLGSITGMLFISANFIKRNQKSNLHFNVPVIILLITFFITILSWLNIFNIEGFDYSSMIILGLVLFSLSFFISLIIDYSKKYKANQELISKLGKEKEKALENFLSGQEQERQRLGQQLHDGLGFRLGQLKKKLSEITSEEEKEYLLGEVEIVRNEIRNYSHNLNSVVLEKYGFISAVNNLIFEAENNQEDMDISIYFEKNIVFVKEQETHFYYILNELVNNTIKYANANSINILFKKCQEGILLEYFDNGIGFDFNKSKSNGLGLDSIIRRTELRNGYYLPIRIQGKGMIQKILLH